MGTTLSDETAPLERAEGSTGAAPLLSGSARTPMCVHPRGAALELVGDGALRSGPQTT